MERKDLILMASEAGFGKLLTGDGLPTMWHGTDLGMLERFAGLVATAEREACAKVCETAEVPIDIDVWMGTKKALTAATAIGLATAIRKRSNAEVTGA